MGNKLRLRTRGILPVQQLKILVECGIIRSGDDYPIEEDQYQPNSLDLRLGRHAHRVRCSFLPENETVDQKIEKLHQYSFSIENGAILEPNCVYIIPLLEELHLPSGNYSPQRRLFNGDSFPEQLELHAEEPLSAKANPKSTTGRLDIFTRVITDHCHRFEEIDSAYSGRLWLEVVPKSFPVKVRTGHRLNQLRIRHGETTLSDQDLLHVHSSDPILFDVNGSPLEMDVLKVNRGLFLSVNLQNGEAHQEGVIGYKAKNGVTFHGVAVFYFLAAKRRRDRSFGAEPNLRPTRSRQTLDRRVQKMAVFIWRQIRNRTGALCCVLKYLPLRSGIEIDAFDFGGRNV